MGNANDKLERKTLVTSRLLDFFSEKELTAQTGHRKHDWPMVIVKELVDNALDACEEAGTAPAIEVCVDEDGISVTDNGPGIPAEVVKTILDFNTRTSSREAYVAPDRGAQGNAIKTIVAIPFVIDGESGHVTVSAREVRHEITVRVDAIQQQPVIEHAPQTDPSASSGTKVFVAWPSSADATMDDFNASQLFSACSIMYLMKQQFLQIAGSFAILNPHLNLTVDWHGERIGFRATDPGWPKWRPSDPTSAHWYETEHFKRLVAAYLVVDEEEGRDRTVREFIGEFRRLSSTLKQKRVLEATGLARSKLSELVDDGELNHAALELLLAAMKEHSQPVTPKTLGVLGKTHVMKHLRAIGCDEDSISYAKKEGCSDDIPWVLECGFGWNEALEDERQLITGVNWSPAIGNPFRELGESGVSLDGVLEGQRAGHDQPVVVLVHLAIARAAYSDRGKSTLVIGG